MPRRPLSPHLTVYRMTRYTLATSIFNRFTGVGLSLGLVLLVYWLTAVAGGPLALARAQPEPSSCIQPRQSTKLRRVQPNSEFVCSFAFRFLASSSLPSDRLGRS